MGPLRHARGFTEWYLALWPAAVGTAQRVLADQGAAEDAASEAFAKALASWRRVGSLPYRDAWLLRVTSNVAIDAARRRSRGARRQPPAPVARGEDDVATRVALGVALSGLPRRQREAVTLRYLADLSEADVAAALGVSVGAARQHVHRGVKALQGRLGPGFGPEEERHV